MAVTGLTLDDVITKVEADGYSLDTRPNKLNLVGIRDAKDTTALTFDDVIAYFYYDDNGRLYGKVAPGTTSPSKYWLQNPMNSGGTAILKSGQYVDTYGLGTHRGKYEALTQQRPVTVMRDNDRNSYLDFFASTTTGLYGINIHRASRGKNNVATIDQDSAGCQVFRDESDFNEMMSLARISRDKYGNKFTYTLIDNRDVIKKVRNFSIVGVVLVGLGAYMYFLYKKGIILKK